MLLLTGFIYHMYVQCSITAQFVQFQCFLKKYSIHRAAAIKRECTFFVPFYFDIILLKEKCTKDIYRCLNSIEVIPTSINKWDTVLSTYLSNNICVTDIFLKFASKQPQFQLYSGYKIEFYIEFYQLTII